MTTNWEQLIQIIDKFEDGIGFSIANSAGHIVLEDYNLYDDNIDFQIAYAESHRAEIIKDFVDPSEASHHIDAVIAFLQLLKCVPEEQREDPRWDNDDEA